MFFRLQNQIIFIFLKINKSSHVYRWLDQVQCLLTLGSRCTKACRQVSNLLCAQSCNRQNSKKRYISFYVLLLRYSTLRYFELRLVHKQDRITSSWSYWWGFWVYCDWISRIDREIILNTKPVSQRLSRPWSKPYFRTIQTYLQKLKLNLSANTLNFHGNMI